MEALLLQEEASARHAAVFCFGARRRAARRAKDGEKMTDCARKTQKTGRVCQQNAE
ncbi:MAG: hypothetical protein MSL26_05325 [Clostridiales bacterium]|nr:hypothetical protein [Clostridiales bacterium]